MEYSSRVYRVLEGCYSLGCYMLTYPLVPLTHIIRVLVKPRNPTLHANRKIMHVAIISHQIQRRLSQD